MKRLVALALASIAIGTSTHALAYCPCYTAASADNTSNCGVDAADGTNPDTAAWNAIFALVSQGPAVWGTQGPAVGDLGAGCGKPMAMHAVPASFPCELLKGITMQESGWRQFCVPTLPGDEVGGASRTIISFDCGYGVGQVTSGMHKGETPSFDRAKVANDPTYNLATGTQIIADKWIATNCVGDNQPTIIEDWYTATWAYNGLAYSNNPSNPNYDPNRGVWDPNVGNAAPYQEKVFGWIEKSGVWTSTKLAYPNPGDVGASGAPPDLPEPKCASPTDCTATRPTHVTACDGQTTSTTSTGAGGSASVGAGGNGGGATSGTPGMTSGSSGSVVTSVGVGGAGTTNGAGGSGGEAPTSDAAGSTGGCSCEAGSTEPSRFAWMAALVAMGAVLARRKSRRL